MLLLPMKKQPLTKKLHKPVHPMAGKAVLGAAILLAVGALVFVYQQSQTVINQSTTPPTPTSILAQSPKVTPTLIYHSDVGQRLGPLPMTMLMALS